MWVLTADGGRSKGGVLWQGFWWMVGRVTGACLVDRSRSEAASKQHVRTWSGMVRDGRDGRWGGARHNPNSKHVPC